MSDGHFLALCFAGKIAIIVQAQHLIIFTLTDNYFLNIFPENFHVELFQARLSKIMRPSEALQTYRDQ